MSETRAGNSDAEIAVESLLTLSGSRSAPKTPAGESNYESQLAHAPVPKLARLLQDGHGKFIFIGDSGNLAFLQNIRRLARTAIGESGLTLDPMRHGLIEALPAKDENARTPSSANLRPSRAEAEDLVNHYMLAVSGAIDLFDKSDILQHLGSWTEVSAIENNSTDSIFYLVLAIGARNQPFDNDVQAEQYFQRGRELAVSSFMDDPSVLTVQSYILIAFYLLTSCRRNGAFMLLGIAIRAAYALGLHRSDISALFESRERQTREKVWKSLRVLDLFMSASLGRPPATSEVDGGNVAWESKARVYEDVRMGASHSSPMLRICFIFERILSEVYCRREVDVALVNSISTQYRDWNMALDAGTDMEGLVEGEQSLENVGLHQTIGLTHLKGAYYWSIILLTRPFLIFDVSSKFGTEAKPTSPSNSQAGNDTTTLSEACIDAALRSIEVASDLVYTPSCPKRPFMVTNSLFVSALVIGLAMFGDYDKSFPLLSSLDQAKLVLGQLAKHDPSCRRYFVITGNLQQSALEHIRRRDEKQNKRRRQGISNLFGDMLARESSTTEQQPIEKLATEIPGGLEASGFSSFANSGTTTPRMPRPEDPSITRKGPTLTTSGILASTARELPAVSTDPNAAVIFPEEYSQVMNPMDMDAPALPSFAEEFPLFSLMNDYTTADPSYFDML